MAKRKPPPRMFLVHDQVESIPVGERRRANYRVRLWQGQGYFPLVLVSGVGDGPRPADHTDHIATWVFTHHLHARDGFFYLEDNGAETLEMVHFRCANLRIMTADSKQDVGRPLVCQAIGSSLED